MWVGWGMGEGGTRPRARGCACRRRVPMGRRREARAASRAAAPYGAPPTSGGGGRRRPALAATSGGARGNAPSGRAAARHRPHAPTSASLVAMWRRVTPRAWGLAEGTPGGAHQGASCGASSTRWQRAGGCGALPRAGSLPLRPLGSRTPHGACRGRGSPDGVAAARLLGRRPCLPAGGLASVLVRPPLPAWRTAQSGSVRMPLRLVGRRLPSARCREAAAL